MHTLQHEQRMNPHAAAHTPSRSQRQRRRFQTRLLHACDVAKAVVAVFPVLPGLADAALLMAADGYGKGKLVGEGKNKEIIEVNTQDAQKSFLLEKDPSPEQLALHACKEFRKVSKERDMSH